MKLNKNIFFSCLVVLIFLSNNIYSQKRFPGEKSISSEELESHVSFLSSPLLKGRANGSNELKIAQNYIVSQCGINGISPANGDSFFQSYRIIETSFDEEKSSVIIYRPNGESKIIDKPLYQIVPSTPLETSIEGEVVFAGYGLRQISYDYNDFGNIDPEGRIILIMDGVPTSEDGKEYLFKTNDWSDYFLTLETKLLYLMRSNAKAVLIVADPKSGAKSINDLHPGLEHDFSASRSLNVNNINNNYPTNGPVIYFADISMANELLNDSGHTLEELQLSIDESLEPHSFVIPNKKISIEKRIKSEAINLNNVTAIIEGSDPELKDEVIIFSSHIDHIGLSDGLANCGADDNASGCAALLSIAKAFSESPKKPKRSIMFLWLSGEEIGLFGSQIYVENPLFPLNKTIANINIDMIGRSGGIADTTLNNPMTDSTEVFVVTGNQSMELIGIANDIDKKTAIDFDYSLSGRDHKLQLFARSDHYNFVKNNIPALFFFTGLHSDYHTPGDTVDKLEFEKMESITKAIYRIGYTLADQKNRPEIDNPYSGL